MEMSPNVRCKLLHIINIPSGSVYIHLTFSNFVLYFVLKTICTILDQVCVPNYVTETLKS